VTFERRRRSAWHPVWARANSVGGWAREDSPVADPRSDTPSGRTHSRERTVPGRHSRGLRGVLVDRLRPETPREGELVPAPVRKWSVRASRFALYQPQGVAVLWPQ
jgi:hypothetical protein